MKFISSFLCMLFATNSALAQNAKVAESISDIEFRTSLNAVGRIDMDSGVRRAAYREQDRVNYSSAQAFLEGNREAFGWNEPEVDLVLVSDRRTKVSRHTTYQQTFEGVAVLDHKVRVNLDRMGRVSLVFSSFEPVVVGKNGFDTNATVSASKAMRSALTFAANGKGLTTEATLGIIQPSSPVLVWEVIVWPKDEPAEYRVHIDAKTGGLVRMVNQAISLWQGTARDTSEPLRGDGTGFVYDPSPLYSAGVSYGAPYVDGDDATNSFLDAERASVVLPGLTQNTSNKWVLEGPYVTITGLNQGGSVVYTPPAESSIDGFTYTRSESGFEAVNAYYHLDKSQRYVQHLGITDRLAQPLTVNPQGLTRDDSFFYPSSNSIMFGTGGVDDAEDPTVLWHEYAHALLEAAAPGLLSTQEGSAFHEGWADYWAASYLRSQVESGAAVRTDWRKLFAWDSGDGTIWSGRTMNHEGIYPQDLCVTSSSGCSHHNDGRMWATTMMEVYDQLGREETDRLSLLSHAYLIAPATFADAAEAVIQADLDTNNGANISVLVDVFSNRGLVSAANYAPVIVHNPLPDSESLGETLNVTAQAIGVASEIESLLLIAESASGGLQQVAMATTSNNVYEAQIVLPTQLDSVFYYFRAEDAGGKVAFLPEGAPQTRFRFNVGEDLHAPVISHQPLQDAGFSKWPLSISTTVTDNFSVQSVQLEYALHDVSGQEVSSGQKTLNAQGALYSTLLDIPFGQISKGSTLQYAIHAQDGSQAENTSRYPEGGFVEVKVTAQGLLRSSTFESSEVNVWTASGLWEKGQPSYGRSVAFRGEGVLATNLGGSYTDQASVSILQLETINLAGVEPSTLSFWHYYDTEHDGTVNPTSSSGQIWDGGLVQYKSGQTANWTTLQPLGGYPGIIQDDASNAFKGEPAFGGFSFGWQRGKFSLPAENGLMIRFVFSTNATNDHVASAFAGWIIDQVEINTETMVDTGIPEIVKAPDASVIASISDPLPIVSGSFSDNTGVTEVIMHWSLTTPAGVVTGTNWLTQHPEDNGVFSIQTDMAFGASAGDRLRYFLEVSDSYSNSIRVPLGAAQNEILFRIQDHFNPIQSVWASGSWLETSLGIWEVTGNNSNALSSLNSNAIVIPQNIQDASLRLTHSYQFGADMAAQVEISENGGRVWTLLEPEPGYPGTTSTGVHSSMKSEKGFVGSSNGIQTSTFSLANLAGKRVLLRFTAGSGDASTHSQKWSIQGIEMTFESDESAFDVPVEFEVLSIYPNPLVSRSNLVFSLPERSDVEIKVFDVLGREVQRVWNGVLGEGSHSLMVERQDLVSGVYLVQIRAGSKVKVVKVVITH